MAERSGLDGVHKLKIGESFSKNSSVAYHSIRYDFKPACLDTSQKSIVEVGKGNQVSVTVPHVEGSDKHQTVYKGNKRPLHKECLLIVDPTTGSCTLEKLTSNIQLKKTRSENVKRPVTPVEPSKMKTAPSPSARKSQPHQPPVQSHQPPQPSHQHPPPPQKQHQVHHQVAAEIPTSTPTFDEMIGEMSDMSTSDSEDDTNTNHGGSQQVHHHHQLHSTHHAHHDPHLMRSTVEDDLMLSESGSDSD